MGQNTKSGLDKTKNLSLIFLYKFFKFFISPSFFLLKLNISKTSSSLYSSKQKGHPINLPFLTNSFACSNKHSLQKNDLHVLHLFISFILLSNLSSQILHSIFWTENFSSKSSFFLTDIKLISGFDLFNEVIVFSFSFI